MSIFHQRGMSQVDALNKGLQDCLGSEEYNYVNELVAEIELFAFETLKVNRGSYKELTEKFCEIEESGHFHIDIDSRLAKLIKMGISNKFWTFDKYESNKPTILNGKTIEIIPPGQASYAPPPSESIEQSYVTPGIPFMVCSNDYTFQVAMKVFFQQYEKFKVASSAVKLCSMIEFISERDYNRTSVKHFILIHCISQRIIHENDYYHYFIRK